MAHIGGIEREKFLGKKVRVCEPKQRGNGGEVNQEGRGEIEFGTLIFLRSKCAMKFLGKANLSLTSFKH